MIFIVVSTGHFDPLIRECARLYDKYDFLGQIGSGRFEPPFSFFRTAPPPQIEKKKKEAELVISHGGAGMTAMLHRFHKKSVIIPKQRRYGEPNDLQIQLARKWGEIGMGEFILDVTELEAAIEKCRKTDYRFPEFPKLGTYLRHAIGAIEAGRTISESSVAAGAK
jgi:UDP-N-acetylglucosamine transferase subunit ALG13